MKIVDSNILYTGNIEDSILVKSFEQYKTLGGEKGAEEIYWEMKKRAVESEQIYIQGMDMSFNGMEVSKDALWKHKCRANVYWKLLYLWFNYKHNDVSYSSFKKAVNEMCCK